jgi:hypothetical protein
MIYQSFDMATSIIVGTLIAFITGYSLATITSCLSKPRKTMEQAVTEHIVTVLHRQGALAAIASGLQMMEHSDADLFANVISVLCANSEDMIINEWIIRAVLIISADINNRINGIALSKIIDISNYIDDNYESSEDEDESVEEDDADDADDADEDDSTEDEDAIDEDEDENVEDAEQTVDSSEETSKEDSPINVQSDSVLNASQSDDSAEADESSAEEEQTSGSSSPIRMKRALTHYSDASVGSSSSENNGTPATPPSSESDEAATSGESLPSESINSTSESNTVSVEDSGNSGITSENS